MAKGPQRIRGTQDIWGEEADRFGRVVEAPGCVFHNMNEEHGYVDTREAGRGFSVGERVRIIVRTRPLDIINLLIDVPGVLGADLHLLDHRIRQVVTQRCVKCFT